MINIDIIIVIGVLSFFLNSINTYFQINQSSLFIFINISALYYLLKNIRINISIKYGEWIQTFLEKPKNRKIVSRLKFDFFFIWLLNTNSSQNSQNSQTLNSQLSRTMTTWGDLSDSQRNYHITFYPPPIFNNQPQYPDNNEVVDIELINPSIGEINSVMETGDDLVRTINYDLSELQKIAVCLWIIDHGSINYDLSELQIISVCQLIIEQGFINDNLSELQKIAACQWIIEHGSDDQVTRLADITLDLRPLPIDDLIPNNILPIDDLTNIPQINNIPDITDNLIDDDIFNDITAVEDLIDGINDIYVNFPIY